MKDPALGELEIRQQLRLAEFHRLSARDQAAREVAAQEVARLTRELSRVVLRRARRFTAGCARQP